MSERDYVQHESFGIITMTRPQGTFDNLFQSNVESNHAVTLEIHEASVGRSNEHDHVHPGAVITSITLSPLQFAEFLCSMGSGMGTPCTIEFRQGRGHMDEPPREETNARKVVKAFVADTQEVMTFAKKARRLAQDILAKGGKMKAADRDELLEIVSTMAGGIADHGPFIMKTAEGAVQRMAAEAKAEVSSHARAMGVPESAVPQIEGSENPGLPGTASVPPDQTPSALEQTSDEAKLGPWQKPALPALPARDITRLKPEDMNAEQLAESISKKLKLFEAQGIRGDDGRVRFYFAGATPGGKGGKSVEVQYISYQGTSILTRDQAVEYLQHLENGDNRSHHLSLRGYSR